jgi:MFS family permease
LEKDLGLKGSQYNTCISILYVGYLFAQIPSNMVLSSKKVRPSLYMAFCMIVWGAVATLTACVHNYTGLLLVRLFLGVVEAPFYPGALYILSLFYTRKEIATRVSILYAGNIFAVAFSGLIAAATFATLDDKHGIHGWQWLFIIEGKHDHFRTIQEPEVDTRPRCCHDRYCCHLHLHPAGHTSYDPVVDA